ncbi:hypothetical protein KIW84_040657 [Lathyrus oleraceus]|uniref:DUF7745 domain-containing protein n=1 Tax=Pisum sativum TaxID=3888 RepID=A0A9D4X7N6_PEA|nr:hypothetical protein KIW84_040657 [Pisum sativum]
MIGYRPTLEEMDYHLCIHEVDLQANLRVCRDFKGFPREYLEKRADDFATSLQWYAMDNIMVLLTFGLMLVPTEKDFVDYTTIDVFLAIKARDEDPHQRDGWKDTWLNSTRTLKEANHEYEACIQSLEDEVQSLVNALHEAQRQTMDSILRRRVVEGLLAFRPSKWSEAYEDVVDLKRQMRLLEEAYDEMRNLCIFIEGHNQEMVDTLKEDKTIMVKLQEKAGYYREKYLKLVILYNDPIEEIPRSLKEDEFMVDIFQPQKEICEFIKMCLHGGGIQG